MLMRKNGDFISFLCKKFILLVITEHNKVLKALKKRCFPAITMH